MAAIYTYLTQDLLSGVTLNELPLHGVTFDRQLNKAGNMGASSSLDNARLDNDDLLAATTPGKTALYIYRENKIVWGGIIWSRWYQSQGKALQFSAQTFESYAARRIFRGDGRTKVTINKAQCQIIQDCWTDLQWSDPRANIQVLGATKFPANDVVRTYVLDPYAFATYSTTIEDITDNYDNSAEYYIDVNEDGNGNITKQLVFGYPRVGNIVSQTNLIIDYPGNILNYYYTENVSDATNRAFATGDADGTITIQPVPGPTPGDDSTAVIWGVAEDPLSFASGYPLLDSTKSYSGVIDQNTINAHARSDVASKPTPTITHTFEIDPVQDPVFGTYGIGDDAHVQIRDSRFPDGLDTVVRVVGWSVTPGESDGVEQVSLQLQEDDTAGGLGG
jgi:hypothetical protein